MRELVERREAVLTAFLRAEQDRLARACHELAQAFAAGGVLIPFGSGAAATDAAHVAVEFMHPVIVGKRALPALAPGNDPTGHATVERLGRPGDVALGLAHTPDPALAAFLDAARSRGMATIALTAEPVEADHALVVACEEPVIVQEVQETAYHVLWELVHVFFEHPGLLRDACVTCGDTAVQAEVVAVAGNRATVEAGAGHEEVAVDLLDDVRVGDRVLCHAGVALERIEDPAGFLYPFLGGVEADLDAVLADVRASTLRKGHDTIALRRGIDLEAVAACRAAMREARDRGGRLIAFGNGGSATDAQDAAADALASGWPAIALVNDAATVTAVGNDVGFDNVFARQLIPLARANDVALAITTSGSSPNILAGLEEARRRGMLTCAIAGYGGGRMTELDWIDHLLTVDGDYIPRIQEAQATIYHLLLA